MCLQYQEFDLGIVIRQIYMWLMKLVLRLLDGLHVLVESYDDFTINDDVCRRYHE